MQLCRLGVRIATKAEGFLLCCAAGGCWESTVLWGSGAAGQAGPCL